MRRCLWQFHGTNERTNEWKPKLNVAMCAPTDERLSIFHLIIHWKVFDGAERKPIEMTIWSMYYSKLYRLYVSVDTCIARSHFYLKHTHTHSHKPTFADKRIEMSGESNQKIAFVDTKGRCLRIWWKIIIKKLKLKIEIEENSYIPFSYTRKHVHNCCTFNGGFREIHYSYFLSNRLPYRYR